MKNTAAIAMRTVALAAVVFTCLSGSEREARPPRSVTSRLELSTWRRGTDSDRPELGVEPKPGKTTTTQSQQAATAAEPPLPQVFTASNAPPCVRSAQHRWGWLIARLGRAPPANE